MASGETIHVLEDHEAAVGSVAFSADGRLALTGSQGGTARLWEVPSEDILEYACTRVVGDLTDEERARFGITDDSPTCPKFGE